MNWPFLEGCDTDTYTDTDTISDVAPRGGGRAPVFFFVSFFCSAGAVVHTIETQS